eukprot:gene13325-14699_t
MGSNVTNKNALDRLIKSLSTNKTLLDNFDESCGIMKRSGKHIGKSDDKDLKKVVENLVSQNAMGRMPGRKYRAYQDCKKTLLENFDVHDFYKWITEHKKKIYTQTSAR